MSFRFERNEEAIGFIMEYIFFFFFSFLVLKTKIRSRDFFLQNKFIYSNETLKIFSMKSKRINIFF